MRSFLRDSVSNKSSILSIRLLSLFHQIFTYDKFTNNVVNVFNAKFLSPWPPPLFPCLANWLRIIKISLFGWLNFVIHRFFLFQQGPNLLLAFRYIKRGEWGGGGLRTSKSYIATKCQAIRTTKNIQISAKLLKFLCRFLFDVVLKHKRLIMSFSDKWSSPDIVELRQWQSNEIKFEEGHTSITYSQTRLKCNSFFSIWKKSLAEH